jgi:hypothetical protein
MRTQNNSLLKSSSDADFSLQSGLTSDEAGRRLKTFGPKAMPGTALYLTRIDARKILGIRSGDTRGGDLLELVLGKCVGVGL